MKKFKRPQYHFTPQFGWMSDPNGLIYHDGIYHLYYQHNPVAPYFGNICWGHATSKDLLSWEHHPIALHAYGNTMIYSGCTVYDRHNVLKQNRPSIAAIYTEHIGDGNNYHERICLAISEDDGYSFKQSNCIVILEGDEPDFRDPNVFFHELTGKWKMVIAKPKKYVICIYESADLINWKLLSEFSHHSPREKYWECPDLFPLMDAQGNEQWILLISGANSDQETWGMFYFIGNFEGKEFKVQDGPIWLDHGHDFYAGITFENHLDERILMAWCGNWVNANDPHSNQWKGIMSLPRKLQIEKGKISQSICPLFKSKRYVIPSFEGRLSMKNIDIEIFYSESIIKLLKSSNELRTLEIDSPAKYIELYHDYGILEVVIDTADSRYCLTYLS